MIEAGFAVHLPNTARTGEHSGLKYTGDNHGARWLAHLLRLGILPEGYILAKPQRALRNLMRQRMRLVQRRRAQILTVKGLVERTTARRLNTERIRALDVEALIALFPDPNEGIAASAHVGLIGAYERVIDMLERQLTQSLKPDPMWRLQKSFAGVGDVWAWTIPLVAGHTRGWRRATARARGSRAAVRPG